MGSLSEAEPHFNFPCPIFSQSSHWRESLDLPHLSELTVDPSANLGCPGSAFRQSLERRAWTWDASHPAGYTCLLTGLGKRHDLGQVPSTPGFSFLRDTLSKLGVA